MVDTSFSINTIPRPAACEDYFGNKSDMSVVLLKKNEKQGNLRSMVEKKILT